MLSCKSLIRVIPPRFYCAVIAAVTGIIISTATRIALMLMSGSEPSHSPLALLLTFGTGLLFDVIVQCCMLFPLVTALALIGNHAFHRRITQCILLAWLCVMNFVYLFTALAEYFFWDEFASRFNFIAVDYLAYTTEVLGNIWQSYPIIPLVLIILVLAIALVCVQRRLTLFRLCLHSGTCLAHRMRFLCAYIALIAVFTLTVNFESHPDFNGNKYNQELSLNGVYTLAAAFLHNQLDYEQFYSTLSMTECDKLLREELSLDNSAFISNSLLDVRRKITPAPDATAHNWNVILILEESLSAYFTGSFEADGRGLTPNLDQLAKDGVTLTRCFASGTRTVRGIEAVQLAIPPTPGQSIVKRTDHDDMYSMGRLFREHGYRNTFLYGGNGFFDNMNDFFASNGYEIQDATSSLSQPKTFKNAWGHCDEDLFQWALDCADRAYNDGVPFHQFILTTSNHRPYTFPAGAIDAPQKHRSSAVRYSDYALGKFIESAKAKPWFANTLFVIVADHCHSTSGREALPLNKYHIPALFYNPQLVTPRTINTVCSQIDIAPTIFGLLNWSYVSEFYGFDITKVPDEYGRAFPGTFQHLGFLNGASGDLTTLYPQRRHTSIHWLLNSPYEMTGPAAGSNDLERAIALYQSASIRSARRLDKVFSSSGKSDSRVMHSTASAK